MVEYTQQKHKPNFVSFAAANPFYEKPPDFDSVLREYIKHIYRTQPNAEIKFIYVRLKGITYIDSNTTIELLATLRHSTVQYGNRVYRQFTERENHIQTQWMQKRHFNSSISSQWFSRLSQTYLLSIWFSVLCFCLVLLCFPFHFNTPPESANAFKHDTRTSTDRHITFVMYRILRVFFSLLSNENDYARRVLPKSHFKFNAMNLNPAKERTNPFSNGASFCRLVCVSVFTFDSVDRYQLISKSLFLILMCLLFNLPPPLLFSFGWNVPQRAL